mmetsp:Transcript_62645/g.159304  ORF Transcript_62645/g.159304 Transcript_62645/m.159304 type:complete len:298 (+) Transcript_62645:76-969(+)
MQPSAALMALRRLRVQRLGGVRTATFAPASASAPALARAWRAAPPGAERRERPEAALGQRRRGFAQQASEEPAKEEKPSEGAGGGSSSSSAGAEKKEEAATGPPCASEAGAETAEAEPKETAQELLEKELAEAEAKLKTEKHELLLALADFENNKKKNLVERDGRRRNAMVNCARKLVDVYSEFDQFAHAEDKIDSLSDSCKALQEGINMTRDLYRSTLERFDIVPLVVEVGQPLVASKHEEVGSVDVASNIPANSVAELVKPGWIFEPNSQKPVVLTKAQVKVAKHGPATPPPLPQ